MKHKLRLDNIPFTKIKAGTKTVELRLYDEKRKNIKVDDIIEFTNRENLEKMSVIVTGLNIYPNFEELYEHYDKVVIGYEVDEIANPCDMEKYYSKEMQEKFGTVAIEIKKI